MKKRVLCGFLLLLVVGIFTACGVADTTNTPTEAGPTATEAPTLSPTPSVSEEVLRSLTRLGNSSRLQKFFEKLMSGEDVTIACIGGSITYGEGVGKSENYPALIKAYCQGLNKDAKVKLVNAGIPGTPSNIGLMRLDNDVLSNDPDLIVVEFAVNDSSDTMTRMMYDSLVRKCLTDENEPAVIILLTVLENGYSCEEYMTAVGKAYDLPVINVKSAIWPEIQAGNMTFADYSADGSHPNRAGHQRIMSYFEYLFDSARADQAKPEPDYTSVYAYSPDYVDMKMYLAASLDPESLGGFSISASGIGNIGEGWRWNKGSKKGSMVFNMTGKDLFIVYVSNKKDSYGALEVYVDGVLKKTINSNDPDGWGGADYATVLNLPTAGEHRVELRMAEDSLNKSFQIVGIATTGEIEGGHLIPAEELSYTERAILNVGNTYRLQELFERAERGEKLTIGFIGGSITMGSGASSSESCYAKLVYNWFVKTFPDAEFTFVNAGIGATTSQFACARLESDLLQYKPDFVLVEFSANDESSKEFKDGYESLVRRILTANNSVDLQETAVVVLNMVQYDTGLNAQVIHNEIAKYYSLPIVSMKESIYKEITMGNLTAADISEDNLHPNDRGHAYAAEIVTTYLEKVLAKSEKADSVQTPETALTDCEFMTAERLNNTNSSPVLNGFTADTSKQNGITDIFKNGYKAKNEGESITFTVTCKDIYLQYRRTNSMGAPKALAIIDGDESKAVELDGNFEDGWGDWLYFGQVFEGSECREHTIEIRITEAGTKKDFYLTSVIVTK